MDRRAYLRALAAAGSLGLAGCSSDGDTVPVDTTAGGDDPEPTVPTAATSSETATPSPERRTASTVEDGEATVVLHGRELVVDDAGYATRVYVDVTVENRGDTASGRVTLTARWYDGDGDRLDDTTGWIATLGAGETWAARVEAPSVDPGAVADVEVSGEYAATPPSVPDGIGLESSNLVAWGDDVHVEGTVVNSTGATVSPVEALAKFYAEDGTMLGTNYTDVAAVAAGETWAFSVEWLGVGGRATRITGHEVVLDDAVGG